MIELKIFIGILFLAFNIFWIKVSKRQNGDFDKKEIVQWLLGNLTIGLFYAYLIGTIFTEWIWGIILGSLILSVGIPLFSKAIKNGNNESLKEFRSTGVRERGDIPEVGQ